MKRYFFLTKEQTYSLDIFCKRGYGAKLTDFAILQGAKIVEKREGIYWTSTERDDRVFCDSKIECYWINGFSREVGARPVCVLNEDFKTKHARDRVLESQFGFYPQRVVNANLQKELESVFQDGLLKETGNTFAVSYGSFLTNFSPKVIYEYLYNKKYYVRVKANMYESDILFSNGIVYENGDAVWVEVEPVNWLVDEKSKLAISEKILFGGKQYFGFAKPDIYKFMNKEFANDLIQKHDNFQISTNDVVLDVIEEKIEKFDKLNINLYAKKLIFDHLKQLANDYVTEIKKYRESMGSSDIFLTLNSEYIIQQKYLNMIVDFETSFEDMLHDVFEGKDLDNQLKMLNDKETSSWTFTKSRGKK